MLPALYLASFVSLLVFSIVSENTGLRIDPDDALILFSSSLERHVSTGG